MEKEKLKRIFDFLEEKEGYILPLVVKLNIGVSLSEEELNVEGDLDLSDITVSSLPKGLKVGGNLYMSEYNEFAIYDDEIREMIKPGYIEGEIYRI